MLRNYINLNPQLTMFSTGFVDMLQMTSLKSYIETRDETLKIAHSDFRSAEKRVRVFTLETFLSPIDSKLSFYVFYKLLRDIVFLHILYFRLNYVFNVPE